MPHNDESPKMNRLFNYRPAVVVLLFIVSAILLAGLLMQVGFAYIIITSLCVIGVVLLIVFRAKVKHFTSLIIGVVCFGLMFGYSTITLNSTAQSYDMDIVNATIRINYVSQDADKIFADVYIADTQLVGQARVESMPMFFDTSTIETGQVFDCVISIRSNQAIYDTLSYNSDYFVQDIRYIVDVDMVYGVETSPLTLTESIRGYITDLVYSVLGQDEAGISLALILGDKYNISQDLKSAFSTSGLSHVLAISGLHVTILASIVSFFLSKTKLGIKKSSIISIFVAFVYVFISGFAPSSVRALIMYALMVLLYVFVKQHDQLSSLALSAIVILFINPMYLYYLGFLMSFSAVLGIILCASNISNSRLLERLPKWLVDIIATSLAVNVTMLPILADTFGSLPVISILSNVLILPIMSILMTLLMAVVIIVCILPFMSFLLYIPAVLIFYLEYVAILLGGTAISTIKLAGMSWLSVPYYSSLVVASDYCGASRRVKINASILASMIVIAFVVVSSIVL